MKMKRISLFISFIIIFMVLLTACNPNDTVSEANNISGTSIVSSTSESTTSETTSDNTLSEAASEPEASDTESTTSSDISDVSSGESTEIKLTTVIENETEAPEGFKSITITFTIITRSLSIW
ncbi:MAG: hypothetical protein A2Y17_09990 [Clostridiales bacterium GWF2_38_85]|nr:MAG: hypothetical protein A2Y17_09990 [Clostridiales bacterium GWF2_38_85]HBL84447.1 hypothetical protein [Clostridiales bacterium]